MTARRRMRPLRLEARLSAVTLGLYAVGYPVALIGHSPVGWVLVFLGGLALLLLLFVTVRRLVGDRSTR